MKSISAFVLVTLFLVIFPTKANASETCDNGMDAIDTVFAKDDLVGGWAYTVQGAPAGYEKGFLLIVKEGKGYKAQIQVGGGTLMAENISVKKNTMTFDVMVEGQKVAVVLTANGSKLTGTSTSAEGVFQISGEKTLSAG
ncbi:hypothetical protein FK220_001435 [Flavobacteriaceae bacterium TP-CH-4]|uniref:Uncharacterized protein n=1 Tax=Pelagihabitans pacificus TaxID=2696054 RepID=A0A967APJ6_9FLAO|nr:hypothetical protein [Pelagihabitans pacificus]NHF57983.1 hypothetical protein [Pelagihabitans pacificus]